MSRRFSWFGSRNATPSRSRTTPARAQVLLEEARAACERREFKAAGKLYKQCIAIYHKLKMPQEEAAAWHEWAQACVTDSAYTHAFEAFGEAIRLYRKPALQEELAVALCDAGAAAANDNDPETARRQPVLLLRGGISNRKPISVADGMVGNIRDAGCRRQRHSPRSHLCVENEGAVHYFSSFSADTDLPLMAAVSSAFVSLASLSGVTVSVSPILPVIGSISTSVMVLPLTTITP